MSNRKTFINLAVRDLKQSMDFFSKLGFGFDARFTDDKAACMIISEHAYAMLLTEPFFKGFTNRALCDTSKQTEALLALSCGSRTEVDETVKKAIAAGGQHAMEPQDHGFMYGWSFYDLDGHHWEVLWMDESATGAPAKPKTTLDAKIVPHLWFIDQAVEAANFYVSLFPNSRVDSVTPIQAENPSGPAGSVSVVEFTLAGQRFQAISAGPLDPFNHAISFIVNCDDQAEVDR